MASETCTHAHGQSPSPSPSHSLLLSSASAAPSARQSQSEALAAAESVRPAVLVLDAAMACRWPQLRAALPSLRCALLLPGPAAPDATDSRTAADRDGSGNPCQSSEGQNPGSSGRRSHSHSHSHAQSHSADSGNGRKQGVREEGQGRVQAGEHASSDVHSWEVLRERHLRRQQGAGSAGRVGDQGTGLPLQWATDSVRSPAIICFTSGPSQVTSHKSLLRATCFHMEVLCCTVLYCASQCATDQVLFFEFVPPVFLQAPRGGPREQCCPMRRSLSSPWPSWQPSATHSLM